ncbi:T9SS type B sorting domain-containing protein [Siphonobacter sp. BAB-5385]|uniref:T9SS type B sorting domain-containing protein n=1 Tax=Siphonobacter sp. BAB-5385 TaxID=1864822 RepID=UPI0034E98771
MPIQELFQVYVPDAFTPNGDSQNDVFLPKVLHVNALKFTVFDRWGNSIFSTEDESEGWDGYVNGKPAPQGSYSYRLDVRNELGDSFTKRGVFRLIR